MTDPLDRIFAQPEPLAPPQGHFGAIAARAKRRKMRRAGVVSAVLVLVVGVGTAGGAVLHQRGEQPPTIAADGSQSPPPQVYKDAPDAASSNPTPANPASGIPKGALPLPTHFQPFSVSTIVATTYVMGNSTGCGRSKCTSVVRSTDNRQSWRTLPGPKAATPGQFDTAETSPVDDVREVRFATQMHGWAYGGGLYSTHDGGASWHQQSVGGTVLDLAIKNSTAYALVGQCGGTSCDTVTLMSTDIHSDGWKAVSGVKPGAGSGQLSFGQGGVAIIGSQVYVFQDARWRAAAAAPCSVRPRSVTASAGSGRIFALCPAGDSGAGSSSFTTVYSDDQGQSWHGSGTPVRLSNAAQTTFTAASSRTVLIGDSDSSIGTPNLQVSRDAGNTFATVSSLPKKTGGWRYVGATSASSLVALPATPDGSLYVSVDTASDWDSLPLSG
ncbi:sialidase family protein [Fodinicola feengrottensis]|uniref:Photosynthesis system II assembly factor Ycf48/Hcf136-like domain-containing protein n=1 Tax=Fodinicola feengrottensis TaxID=435914 RepID=A0ABN2IPH1_9ACTN|nr:sialidase family protein [Fodinicola feengrottensis]